MIFTRKLAGRLGEKMLAKLASAWQHEDKQAGDNSSLSDVKQEANFSFSTRSRCSEQSSCKESLNSKLTWQFINSLSSNRITRPKENVFFSKQTTKQTRRAPKEGSWKSLIGTIDSYFVSQDSSRAQGSVRSRSRSRSSPISSTSSSTSSSSSSSSSSFIFAQNKLWAPKFCAATRATRQSHRRRTSFASLSKGSLQRRASFCALDGGAGATRTSVAQLVKRELSKLLKNFSN